jgi:hypothetical protein
MYLGYSNCTIRKSNVGYAFELAPTAPAELLLQPDDLTDSPADRDDLNVANPPDDSEVHWNASPCRSDRFAFHDTTIAPDMDIRRIFGTCILVNQVRLVTYPPPGCSHAVQAAWLLRINCVARRPEEASNSGAV